MSGDIIEERPDEDELAVSAPQETAEILSERTLLKLVSVANEWRAAAPPLETRTPSHRINYLNGWIARLPTVINGLPGCESTTWSYLQISIADIEANPNIYKNIIKYLEAINTNTELSAPIELKDVVEHRPFLAWLHHHLIQRFGPDVWS